MITKQLITFPANRGFGSSRGAADAELVDDGPEEGMAVGVTDDSDGAYTIR